MPELDREVRMRDPAKLIDDPRNARTHSPEQLRQIRRSMEEFGNYNPILLRDDEATIGAGHGRKAAALLKPAMAEVPTLTLRGLTDEQWRGLIIADNRIALNSSWNDALLKMELEGLQGAGFDLSLTGFSSADLTSIFSTQEGNTDPDQVPEPPTVPVSQRGDLWRLGDHFLLCGDATNAEDVKRVLAGHKPHLMVTDPPYGVGYDPSWRDKQLKTAWSAARATGEVPNDDRSDWREAWALFPGDVAYVWHGGLHGLTVESSLLVSGFEIRAQIIWAKQAIVVGRGHYHWRHEPCFYAVRKGSTGHWSGDRKQNTVWEIQNGSALGGKRDDSVTGHGTQKPVEAMARPIRNNSAPGDRVYEPFAGSGTTIIAAQMNKRVCYAIEIEPKYVDVCCRRFAEFSGIEPILADTGESWADVKARREGAELEVV
jgi:DNA modification methylase